MSEPRTEAGKVLRTEVGFGAAIAVIEAEAAERALRDRHPVIAAWGSDSQSEDFVAALEEANIYSRGDLGMALISAAERALREAREPAPEANRECAVCGDPVYCGSCAEDAYETMREEQAEA